MSIPDVPHSVPCVKCGQLATVKRLRGRQGEQLVIARMEGKFYVTVNCPKCGDVQQEVKSPSQK